MKLEECRKEIDEIDLEIVGLLNRRARVVQNVGVVKAKAGLPIVDVEREDEVLSRILQHNEGLWENKTLLKIYRDILQRSRQIQIETKAGFKKQSDKNDLLKMPAKR